MLKYVALLRVDQPALWYQWTYRPTEHCYISPIVDDKIAAEKWLKDELKKYPDRRVNSSHTDRKYYIHTTIIAFDDKESKNFEKFLETWHI